MEKTPINPAAPSDRKPRKNKKSLIITLLVLFIVFGLPIIVSLIMMAYAYKFANEFMEEGFSVSASEIISSDADLMQSIEVFDTAAKYKRFNDLGLATHKDCEVIANNIVGFRREDGVAARWFGTGFCGEKEIAVFSESASLDFEATMREINMDDLTAEALSFSDGQNCASLIISRLGVLEYSFDPLSSSEYCKADPVRVHLHSSDKYSKAESPAEQAKDEEEKESTNESETKSYKETRSDKNRRV